MVKLEFMKITAVNFINLTNFSNYNTFNNYKLKNCCKFAKQNKQNLYIKNISSLFKRNYNPLKTSYFILLYFCSTYFTSSFDEFFLFIQFFSLLFVSSSSNLSLLLFSEIFWLNSFRVFISFDLKI